MHGSTWLWLGLSFALACSAGLALPSSAHASTGPGVIDIQGPDLTRLPMITLGVSALAFGITDLAFALHDRPLPVALSIAQIAVAGFLMPTLMLSSYGFRELDGGEQAVFAVFGALNIAWFCGHGFQQLHARQTRPNRELGR